MECNIKIETKIAKKRREREERIHGDLKKIIVMDPS